METVGSILSGVDTLLLLPIKYIAVARDNWISVN